MTFKARDLRQNTPEWAQWRGEAGVVSASQAAVLIGVGYQTLNQLYRERMGINPSEPENHFMRWGREHEDDARMALEDVLETAFLLPLCVEHEEHPLLRASLDGWDGAHPCEIKCPSDSVFADVLALGTDSEGYRRYFPQVQFQMLVTGAQAAFLFFWRPDDQKLFRVERDDDYLAQLLDRALDFSRRLLEADEPPVDPSQDVYRPTGGEVAEWTRLTETYKAKSALADAAKADVARHEAEMEALKAQMVKLKGNFARASFNGVDITSSTSMRLDTKRLRAELPDDFLRKYEKPSESVRITVRADNPASATAIDSAAA